MLQGKRQDRRRVAGRLGHRIDDRGDRELGGELRRGADGDEQGPVSGPAISRETTSFMVSYFVPARITSTSLPWPSGKFCAVRASRVGPLQPAISTPRALTWSTSMAPPVVVSTVGLRVRCAGSRIFDSRRGVSMSVSRLSACRMPMLSRKADTASAVPVSARVCDTDSAGPSSERSIMWATTGLPRSAAPRAKAASASRSRIVSMNSRKPSVAGSSS